METLPDVFRKFKEKGVQELMEAVERLLKDAPKEKLTFKSEMIIDERDNSAELPFEVYKHEKREHTFVVEGPKIERMLGYTNLEDEKGFLFFIDFMRKNGIIKMLEDLGIEDGDTVKIYGHEFDFYHDQ